MPPHKKFDKSDIIDTSLKIIETEGENALNARKLGSVLGCSVQPIFHNFTSMEDLKQELYNKIYQTYENFVVEVKEKPKAYKEMGLSYIRFAKEYPEFFKIIFMHQIDLNSKSLLKDKAGKEIIEAGQKLTGFTYEEQKKFHIKVWIFTHGLACLVANKTIDLSEEEIANLLEESVREMLMGYKKKKENTNEKSN